jgi:hypothetical protein
MLVAAIVTERGALGLIQPGVYVAGFSISKGAPSLERRAAACGTVRDHCTQWR